MTFNIMDQLSGFYFSMELLAARLEATAVTRIACISVAPGTTLPEGESYVVYQHLEICRIFAWQREGSRCYREPVVVGTCH
jgi:hypothetical protein